MIYNTVGMNRSLMRPACSDLAHTVSFCFSFPGYSFIIIVVYDSNQQTVFKMLLCGFLSSVWIRPPRHWHAGGGQIQIGWSWLKENFFRHVCTGSAAHLWGILCQADEAAARRHIHIRSSCWLLWPVEFSLTPSSGLERAFIYFVPMWLYTS